MTGTEKFVIVGFGWVGQANAIALSKLGYDVSYFDPGTPPHHYGEYSADYQKLKKLHDVRESDSPDTWHIVCVGDKVSEEGHQDISSIKRALESLHGVEGGVILRSTVIPDLLKDLAFDFYVPEFLHEKNAVEECIHPYLFVVGKNSDRREPAVFAKWRTHARKVFDGTPRDASFIKYLSNLWNSVRIAFVNEFGDAIGRPSSKEELNKIEDVIDFLFDGRGYLRYGRAFGGHCLPKDTRAFMTWYGKESTLSLLSGTYASNSKHKELEEKFPLMPEWYSHWPNPHVSGWQALRDLSFAIWKHVKNPLLIFKR